MRSHSKRFELPNHPERLDILLNNKDIVSYGAMDSLKKASFWILWGVVVLALLGVAGLVTKSDEATDTPEKPQPALTAAELNEFEEVVLDMDPDQRMVTKVAQWQSTRIVDVTVGDNFISMNQTQQGEMVVSMRSDLSKICKCSPYLRFNTEGGQRIVTIGRKQPKFR
ncbi:MAG: hypothetical protein AAGI69_30660 [Cyanobacteria bacterium P01_H01_bin.21]